MKLRPEMEDAPTAMTGRPVDHRGFYVPWFVTAKTDDGLWDFVRIDPRRIREAYDREICFISGEPLGRYRSFVIGPMCCINRITAEPPSKREIAEWSTRVCPFISNPMAKRPDLEDGTYNAAPGVMIPDNPGVIAIWTVDRHDYTMDRNRIINLGDPSHLAFYTHKREATPDEVRKAMVFGANRLLDMAQQQSAESVQYLEEVYLPRVQQLILKHTGITL